MKGTLALVVAFATLTFVAGSSSCQSGDQGDSSGDLPSTSGAGDTGAPCPDTAWLEDLPVADCPGPEEGAIVKTTEMYNAAVYYYTGSIDPTGFYLQLSGFAYSDDGIGESSCGYGATDAVVYGDVVGEYIYDLYFSVPLAEHPVDYQGVYPYDGDAESWSDEPAMQLVIGWYDTSAGYQHVRTFMSSDAGTCLSRVRPGRVTGVFWWTPEERYADDYAPLYFTFDLRDPMDEERDCLHQRYDSSLTEEEIWPELDCPDETSTP